MVQRRRELHFQTMVLYDPGGWPTMYPRAYGSYTAVPTMEYSARNDTGEGFASVVTWLTYSWDISNYGWKRPLTVRPTLSLCHEECSAR